MLRPLQYHNRCDATTAVAKQVLQYQNRSLGAQGVVERVINVRYYH